MMGGLLNVGKAAAPKLAAGGLLGLGATASDDAEAAVTLRLLKEAPEAYNSLRKQLARDRQKGLSPMRTAEKFIHDQSFTNYDKGFNTYARKVDGTSSGDYWKSGVQGLYDEILGAVDEPDPMVVEAMDAWLESHLGRETGATMAQNRAKARAARAAGGAATAATAAGANSAEMPLMGPGFASGFGPQEEGSSAAMNGFEPFPVYDPTPVSQRNQDVMFAGPLGALGGSFSGGAKEYGIVADGTMQSGQSLVRMIYEMMTGGGWDGAKEGAQQVINQGVDATQQQFGDYVENKTGDEVLGSWAKWLPYLASPL